MAATDRSPFSILDNKSKQTPSLPASSHSSAASNITESSGRGFHITSTFSPKIRKLPSFEALNEKEVCDLSARWAGLVVDLDPRPESFSKAGAAIDAASKALVAASKALDAASKALDSAIAATAAAAPRPEERKPETKIPVENPAPAYKSDTPINYELHNKIGCEKARKALDYYKGTKDEEFELLHLENCENDFYYPNWITHLTFKAKPKDRPDSCPKLFFAEVYEKWTYGNGENKVKMCMTMDPSGPDVMNGCGYIQHDEDEKMLHPKGVQFWAGPPS